MIISEEKISFVLMLLIYSILFDILENSVYNSNVFKIYDEYSIVDEN